METLGRPGRAVRGAVRRGLLGRGRMRRSRWSRSDNFAGRQTGRQAQAQSTAVRGAGGLRQHRREKLRARASWALRIGPR